MSEEPPITEPVPAPEIFADGFACVSVTHGVARFVFYSLVNSGEGDRQERRIVARLTTPAGLLWALSDISCQMVAKLAEQGAEARPN